jgi:hypothetical protein
MDTGNPGTATVSVAAMGPGAPPTSECEELSNKNNERRAELNSKTKDQSIVGPNGSGAGTTVSSCRATGPGGATVQTSHNNHKATAKCPGSLQAGGSDSVRSGAQPTTCGHVHPKPSEQKSGHAEARLLDGMAAGPKPSSVTFNIDWRKKKGKPSKMPCKTCHEYMCKAQGPPCNIEIFLCDSKGNKQPCPCPANKKNRKALKKTIDG